MQWIALLICLLALPPAVAGEGEAIRIAVDQVNAHGLVVGMGGVLDKDVVIANLQSSRISLDAEFQSTSDFYAALTDRIGAKAAMSGEVLTIRPKCADPAGPVKALPALSPQRVTLAFNHIPIAMLLGLIASQNGMAIDQSPTSAAPQVVGIRMRLRSWDTVYTAAVQATGATLVQVGSRFAIEESGASSCFPRPTLEEPAKPSPTECPMKDHPLIRNSGRAPVCEPLEAYKLSDLTVRGFVAYQSTRYVVLEAPDRLTFFVKRGDYLGHDMGRITTIDNEGFIVREILQDSRGSYYLANTRISYDNRRSLVSREYP